MGASKLSRYSYDERMKSIFNVDIDEAKNEEHAVYSIRNIIFKEEDSEKENELDEKHISEDLNKLSLRHQAKDLTEADVLNSSPKTNNDEKTDQNVEKDSDAKVSFKSSKEKKRAIDRDPLHWFGLLVSPSLRISQQHFKTVVSRCIQQANLEYKLANLESQYNTLQQEKSRIIQEIESSAKVVKANVVYMDAHDDVEDNEDVEDQVVPQ
ncbi:hypothetical protein VKS41_001000 [Umbelopsis sp. WA50703]